MSVTGTLMFFHTVGILNVKYFVLMKKERRGVQTQEHIEYHLHLN